MGILSLPVHNTLAAARDFWAGNGGEKVEFYLLRSGWKKFHLVFGHVCDETTDIPFHGSVCYTTIRAAPKNHEKRSAVQESQGRAAVLDGRQPACVLRLALRSLPSLPFFS